MGRNGIDKPAVFMGQFHRSVHVGYAMRYVPPPPPVQHAVADMYPSYKARQLALRCTGAAGMGSLTLEIIYHYSITTVCQTTQS